MIQRRCDKSFDRSLYWSETCCIALAIRTGDRWFNAWVHQQWATRHKLSRVTGISQERLNAFYADAAPSVDELEALARAFKTNAASLSASIELDGLYRSGCDPTMCNLYNIKVTRLEFNAYFQATDDWRRDVEVQKDYVSPGKPGYVVREEDGERVLSTMLWGFPKDGKPVTNVRNYDSPFWRSALNNPERRCLVPVTEFQEWSAEPMPDTGKKKAFWFSVPSQPIFALAGIWRPTEAAPVFSFLTCGYEGDPSAHLVGAVHPKACPVILHPEDYDTWLHSDLADVLRLACAYPSQLMAIR